MKSLRRFFARLAASLTGHRDEDRLRSEVEEHIALLADDYIRGGISPAEAHRQAVLVARLDNLGKGASGAAVQNIRLMLGLPAAAEAELADA